MEAGSVTGGTNPRPTDEHARRRPMPFAQLVREAGDMGSFSARAVLELRGTWRYAAEILRQAGILILGSALLIWIMTLVIGAECALFGNYLLRSFGATGLLGTFSDLCAVRELTPYMFGYIFAAKVGCGLVAEVGSMRIAEEIDALESVGVDPMRYIVGTRLLATILAVPFIYLVGLLTTAVGGYLVAVVQLGEISQGGWELGNWTLQTPTENLYSSIKVMAMAIAIVLVGMYYGYRARGGPVGVGAATARSMIVNLVLIHVIGSVGTTIFWGLDPRLPSGG